MVSRRLLIILIVCFGPLCILIITNQFLLAQDLAEKEKALNAIADFADRICNTIPLGGGGSEIELSGDAKAELNSLIKKLVDLKIQGAAKYTKTEYQGVLQKDLANALNNNSNCRLEATRLVKSEVLGR